ncbi:MAG: hypothetical protein Q9224_003592 [Gallowayella concinna]
MPRLQPHPQALFSLYPRGEQAAQVTQDPRNRHLVWKSQTDGGDPTLALDIGFHIRSKSCSSRASISKIQCSFEINLDTKVVMLFDRSHAQTTQVYSTNAPDAGATPFESGRPRQVVVMETVNEVIGMGGSGRDLVMFKIAWHQDQSQTMEKIRHKESLPQDYLQEVEETPHLAHTLSQELDTLLPSRMETRVHTPGPERPRMRYKQFEKLGSGKFGSVFRALDLDTGRFMALKLMQPPSNGVNRDYAGKREVETLSRISHRHIVEFYHCQGWSGPEVQIFMGLKDGSLGSLLGSRDSQNFPSSSKQLHNIAKLVYHQMLQALDFLSFHNVIHRDVKPENILYSTPTRESGYRFQLGDFGLCNPYRNAQSQVGTPLYMAPELYFDPEQQTPKVDIWSLLVTMLWTLDFDGFREKSHHLSLKQSQSAVLSISSGVDLLREMARVNPVERASAAQLLAKYCDGAGLTTPSQRIPQLVDAASTPASMKNR